MAKGDIIKFDFEEVICTETGKTMTRLTKKDYLSHHPYFYNKMFTTDGKSMLLASTIDGNRNYYLLDMSTGNAKQITDGENIDDFGGSISPDDKSVFYVKGTDIIKLDLETLNEEVIYQAKDDWAVGGPHNFSSDSKYMVMIHSLKSDLVTGYSDPWESFLAQGKVGCRCRLVLFDLVEQKEKILLDTKDYRNKNQWITHPLIRPNNNDFISYCHEGLGGTVDARIWFTDSEGSHYTCARNHDIEGQIISHEFWYKDGSKMGYVRIDKPDVFDNGMICTINPDTLEDEVIVTLPRCSHFITSWDDKLIVADGAMPDKQFMTPHLVKEEDKVKLEDLFIYLVDIDKKSFRKLVAHKSSFKNYGHNQDTHPHPSFTPDNKSVVFTSDFEGLPAVYLVDVQ